MLRLDVDIANYGMSRPASFALGVAAAGVGYIYLRDRFWSRPTAVSTGLRRAQEELPGSHPIPLVRVMNVGATAVLTVSCANYQNDTRLAIS